MKVYLACATHLGQPRFKAFINYDSAITWAGEEFANNPGEVSTFVQPIELECTPQDRDILLKQMTGVEAMRSPRFVT